MIGKPGCKKCNYDIPCDEHGGTSARTKYPLGAPSAAARERELVAERARWLTTITALVMDTIGDPVEPAQNKRKLVRKALAEAWDRGRCDLTADPCAATEAKP